MPLTRKRFLSIAGRGALGTAAYVVLGCPDGSANGPAEGDCPDLPSKQFNYRGSAFAMKGKIELPLPGRDQAPAARFDFPLVDLKRDGGHDEKRLAEVKFPGIVYIGEATGLVTGNPDFKKVPRTATGAAAAAAAAKSCIGVYRTVVTASVRGVDVDGVVRADAILASLESDQPDLGDRELDMRPVGYFTNLRIKHYPIVLHPADHLKALQDFGKKSEIDKKLEAEVKEIEKEVAREPYTCGHASPTLGGSSYVCSIFSDKAIRAAVKGIPGVTACKGGRIHVDDLGDVYLGRLVVTQTKDEELRELTMLRVVLNSPPRGEVDICGVVGDGGRPS
jgi:hypothetical protein